MPKKTKRNRKRPRTVEGVGPALRTRREQLKLTQAQLGDRIGWSAQVLSQYECGQRQPTIPTLQRWCQALGLGFEWFPGQPTRFHAEK
jgi:transcriptional regulator with XRE-family HTH domain